MLGWVYEVTYRHSGCAVTVKPVILLNLADIFDVNAER